MMRQFCAWRLLTLVRTEISRHQRDFAMTSSYRITFVVKLRRKLHEQKFLYQWLRGCAMKRKPVPLPVFVKAVDPPDFAKDPPIFFMRPASAEPHLTASRDLRKREASNCSGRDLLSLMGSSEGGSISCEDLKKATARAFDVVDSNRDGFITRSEFNRAFDSMDRDGDGVISRSEWGLAVGNEDTNAQLSHPGAGAVTSTDLAGTTSWNSAQILPAERHVLASQAMVNDSQYRQLLDLNRRQIQEQRHGRRAQDGAGRCLGWGMLVP